MYRFKNALTVILHETIRKNEFWCETALQYWCVIVLKSYNIVPTMIETMCCAKNRRCESYRVTSPSKWIKTKTSTYRIYTGHQMDDRERSKTHQNKNDDKEYCRRLRVEFNLRHNVQFYRFRTF